MNIASTFLLATVLCSAGSASTRSVSGPLAGSWSVKVKNTDFEAASTKPVTTTELDDVTITEDSAGDSSNMTMTGVAGGGQPFTMTGKRIRNRFALASSNTNESNFVVGTAVINKKTGLATSFTATGGGIYESGIGSTTVSGKRPKN